MTDLFPLEKLLKTAPSRKQQKRLYALIEANFKSAIQSRSPRQRPPGKAGLRAEKGYYRLLYLEEEFRARVNRHDSADSESPTYHWNDMTEIMHQLEDLPELRSEILDGVESALDQMSKK